MSPPVFSNCPSNIVASADRGTTSTLVTWSHPTASDNSGFIPNITHHGKQPGDTFSAGEHNIQYLALDKTGNVGECKFKVFVLGNLRMPYVEMLATFHFNKKLQLECECDDERSIVCHCTRKEKTIFLRL